MQKLLYQFLTRIFFFAFLVYFFRQEHPAFDIQKSSRHYEKFAHDIQIFSLHIPDVFHILICDLYDRYIVNVYFVFIDQMKQKVQGTFKYFQFNRNPHIHSSDSADG